MTPEQLFAILVSSDEGKITEEDLTTTPEAAAVLLAATELKWSQSGENPGWFFVILSPTTVTRIWCEDVPAFLAR